MIVFYLNRSRFRRNAHSGNEKQPFTTMDEGLFECRVGAGGFEPPTSCTPSKHAIQAAPRPEGEVRLSGPAGPTTGTVCSARTVQRISIAERIGTFNVSKQLPCKTNAAVSRATCVEPTALPSPAFRMRKHDACAPLHGIAGKIAQ